MHIPDGYLSPATCAITYAAALPFWYVAFARVKRLLHTRMVPLLAVFSAFSFVIMMFNLPLPGGTTGHAVGVAVAAIVLGPWASMIVVSVALLIQAVFFGDGGITTLGANCLNMAVVGSLAAHWAYTAVAGRSGLTSLRRVVAAGLAGYLAINLAALLTAVEFGVQPLFFHDASGTPLYAPYPLSVAVPAMMGGHLTFAGLAEMAISVGLVAYLQRANPELLAFSTVAPVEGRMGAPPWKSARTLWYAVAALMILSPLGLVAAGTAWGEWGVEDFGNAQTRQEIQQVSGNTPPPAAAPQGMERLSSLWKAPVPDYAPGFVHNASLGYILSAVSGTGLILLSFLLVTASRARKGTPAPPAG